METKKNPAQDLTKKSGLFFGAGLFVALSCVITAFEWKSYSDPVLDLVGKDIDDFPPTLIVPPTRIMPPVPKPILNPRLVEVKKEQPVPEVVIIYDFTDDSIQVVINTPEPEPEVADIIYTGVIEESATPKGGFQSFYKYVSEQIKYPIQAKRMGIEGKVFVEFIIGKDGILYDVRAIKGIGAGCDEEAVRVVQGASSWNPGKQRGKPVKQRYTLPIIFKLG